MRAHLFLPHATRVAIVLAGAFAVAAFAAAAVALPGCSGDTSSAIAGDGGASGDGAISDASVSDATRDSGPSPDAGAAPSCATYCAVVEGACAGEIAAYVSDDACRSICATWKLGAVGDSDDSVGCRQHQADLAHDDPSRCRSAGPSGGDVCGTSHCTDFCALDLTQCGSDAGAPYANEPTCETACAKYAYPIDAGDGSNATGNTLNCRMYHLEKAYEPDAAANECANTAESSPSLQFPCQ